MVNIICHIMHWLIIVTLMFILVFKIILHNVLTNLCISKKLYWVGAKIIYDIALVLKKSSKRFRPSEQGWSLASFCCRQWSTEGNSRSWSNQNNSEWTQCWSFHCLQLIIVNNRRTPATTLEGLNLFDELFETNAELYLRWCFPGPKLQ